MAAPSGKCSTIPEKGEADRKSMKRAFKRADSDASGKIQGEQFCLAAKDAGFDTSTEDLQRVLSKFDKDTDSEINFGEFVDMMKYIEDSSGQDFEANLREAFRKFDRDGSGYISPEELRYVVCHTGEKLSEDEARELIDMFDKNKDGQLSWEEFVEFIKTSMPGEDDKGEEVVLPEEEGQGEKVSQEKAQEGEGGCLDNVEGNAV